MAATKLLSDNGVTSGITGYQLTGGNDGTLQLQTTTSGGTATTAMTIDTTQQVGIGITPNAWAGGNTALQMAGPSMWGASGVSHWSTNTYFDGTNYKYIASNYVSDYYQLNGTHVWRTAASGTAGANVSSLNESMRIDASGNVGVGINTPLQRFNAVNTSITGGAPATSGSAADPNAVARFGYGSVVTDFGAYVSGQSWIQTRAAGSYAVNYDMVLQPNGGSLLIGTPTGNGKVNIYNAANAYIEVASNGRVAGTTSMMFGQDINGTGYVWNRENQAVIFGTNNTTRMTLTASGNLQFGTANAGIIFNKTGALNNSTLNDYEEGTWTPTMNSGGTMNSIVYATYVKIGRLVNVNCYISCTPTNNGSTFQIAGLPFANNVATSCYTAGTIGYTGSLNASTWHGPIIAAGGTYFYFHQNNTTTTVANSAFGGVANEIIVSISYQTA